MVGKDETPWEDYLPEADPPHGWTEAWDEIVPGYQRALYAEERQANMAARALRAWGFSAATEFEERTP